MTGTMGAMTGKRAGRLGDRSTLGGDQCGGRAYAGSGDVLINSRPALRVGDPGRCESDCSASKWIADDGAPFVLVNHQRAHRLGDAVEHGSGGGKLVTGSRNVLIGDAGIERPVPHDRSVELSLCDGIGRAIKSAEVVVRCPHKPEQRVAAAGPSVTLSGLCAGASIKIVTPLEDHEWT